MEWARWRKDRNSWGSVIETGELGCQVSGCVQYFMRHLYPARWMEICRLWWTVVMETNMFYHITEVNSPAKLHLPLGIFEDKALVVPRSCQSQVLPWQIKYHLHWWSFSSLLYTYHLPYTKTQRNTSTKEPIPEDSTNTNSNSIKSEYWIFGYML